MVTVVRKADPTSFQYDRYAFAVKKMEGRVALVARLETVGHLLLQIGTICHYFITYSGEICIWNC